MLHPSSLFLPWEPTEPTVPPFESACSSCSRKPGSSSGFKGVSKNKTKKIYQARRTVRGKPQHVWTSASPHDCAYMLAVLEANLVDDDMLHELQEMRDDGRAAKPKIPDVVGSIDRLTRPWKNRPPSKAELRALDDVRRILKVAVRDS